MATNTPFDPSTLKALTFDVFGTTVSWRVPVTAALVDAAAQKLASQTLPLPLQARLSALTHKDWALFTHRTCSAKVSALPRAGWSRESNQLPNSQTNPTTEWHASYTHFTHTFLPGTTPFQPVSVHLHTSLVSLLSNWSLAEVYTPAETASLAQTWHLLPAWPDSVPGLTQLRAAGIATATLSNGNTSLLASLDAHSALGFNDTNTLFGAEDFGAYKPAPETYLGVCERLGGLAPGEVGMVAAHLGDLEAARGLGMRTVSA